MKRRETTNGGHRCDPDDPGNPTFRDELARVISNSDSPQPGRICMVDRDYKMADDVIRFLHSKGLLLDVKLDA
jgi:hypothetical protein